VTQPGKSGIDGWREVSLSAGHRFVLDRAAGKAATSDIALSSVAAWRNGRLVVENALLDDVVTAIGRYHSGAILVTDRTLRESRVTGVYDLRDPARALRVLSAPYGGVVRELTPYVLVLSAG
jgi:transmembrane sensor